MEQGTVAIKGKNFNTINVSVSGTYTLKLTQFSLVILVLLNTEYDIIIFHRWKTHINFWHWPTEQKDPGQRGRWWYVSKDSVHFKHICVRGVSTLICSYFDCINLSFQGGGRMNERGGGNKEGGRRDATIVYSCIWLVYTNTYTVLQIVSCFHPVFSINTVKYVVLITVFYFQMTALSSLLKRDPAERMRSPIATVS